MSAKFYLWWGSSRRVFRVWSRKPSCHSCWVTAVLSAPFIAVAVRFSYRTMPAWTRCGRSCSRFEPARNLLVASLLSYRVVMEHAIADRAYPARIAGCRSS